ncbi:hypothetical protein EDB85DRAFT_1959130, partial [Lactarius pseudohatsudake]
PPPFPICAEGGVREGMSPPPPTPRLLPWAAPPHTRGIEAREGTRPLSPSLPAPPPWPRRSYARKWGTRAHTPLVRKGVHEGTTPPAAPYARVRHTRAHPSSFARDGGTRGHAAPAPRFPLVRATPFARKGGMRGQAAPSRGAPFAREWAHEGKPCRAAGPARLRALAFTAPAPRSRGIVRL